MAAPRTVRFLAPIRGAGIVVALCSFLAVTLASAQEPPASVGAQAAPAGPARAANRWDLPRIFYEPRLRRSLDAQDRALRLGQTAGTAPSGPRFDGWLSGPTGTHAWVSGNRYLADRNGRLHATVERADPGTDEMENAAAQLDRNSGELLVHRENEGAVHLRVGEAENPIDPLAPPAEGQPSTGGSGPR